MPEQPNAESVCFYGCGATKDLRPYGPGGALVCFPCATATPERNEAAQRAYGALLDANAAISPTGVVAIGGEEGPRPFDPRHIDGSASDTEARGG